jgi:hypothetical protein
MELSVVGIVLATGTKAADGTLGIEPGTGRKLSSIATEARAAGRKVAILSTVSIDHATPAAFYAQADDRNAYNAIAMQLPRSGYDIFAGSETHATDHLAASGVDDILTTPGRAGDDLAVDVVQHFVHSSLLFDSAAP